MRCLVNAFALGFMVFAGLVYVAGPVIGLVQLMKDRQKGREDHGDI